MIRQFIRDNNLFLIIIVILVTIAGAIFDQPKLAMWFGFGVAGYSAIANDSIQTLGTFITTNKNRPWWVLWLFIGGILVITHIWGFYADHGAIDFGRLKSIPQPETFTFLQLLSPIALIVMTRCKMPVSTSFLILSTFSSTKTIQGMLWKTFFGYFLAFVCAFVLWTIIAQWSKRFFKERKKDVGNGWYVAQWFTTGFLWSQWLMQDTANMAVFLPRTLTGIEFIGVITFFFLAMGWLMYIRGDKIQEVVTEKKDINNVRSATIIDFFYALILMYFKQLNNLPMSTTWVFLGLLAGRELALTERSENGDAQPYKRSLKLVGKDIVKAGIGLLVSLILALMLANGF